MKRPHIEQHDMRDCGAACLAMISEYHGLKLSIAKCRELIKVDDQGANIYGIVEGSKQIGLTADALEGDREELLEGIKKGEVTLPFIARIVNDDSFTHFIVVYELKKDSLIVGDPAKQRITKLPMEKFFSQWQGHVIIFEKNQDFKKGDERKGIFKQYFKYIVKQKKAFALILVVSVVISFINIASSTIFRYILNDATIVAIGQSYDEEDDDTADGETTESSQESHKPDEENSDNAEESSISMDEEISEPHDILAFLQMKLNQILSFAFQNIQTVSISIIVLVILKGLLQLLRGYALSITAKKIEIPMTLDYYNHLIDLPPSFFGTRKTGELMTRFSDTSKIREAISNAVITVIIDSVMAVLVGIYLCSISYILFLISLATLAVYAVLVLIFRKPIKNLNHEVMEKDARVESYLKESLDGIETIKSYQYESSVKDQTKNLFTNMLDQVVKGSVVSTLLEALVSTFTTIGTVCLLWVGTDLFISNIISLSDLFMYNYMLSYFFDPVSRLIDLQPTLQTAIVAGERLDDILSVETENNQETANNNININGNIEIKNVDFRYGNRELTLKNVNMYIPKNRKTAIIGSSGCGKTTVAKLLMKFYQPEKGIIKMNNNDISEYSPEIIRERIAYISQNVFFFSDTIKNNLKMGSDVSDEEIERVCKLCCAHDFIQEMPFGYNTPLEENGANLSTGQKQRLSIARALLKKPDILIMDEATGNLDVKTEDTIRKMIDEVTKDITCVIIAHRLNTIKNCDYIYVMDKGEVVQWGTHEQLMQEDGIYANYWKI